MCDENAAPAIPALGAEKLLLEKISFVESEYEKYVKESREKIEIVEKVLKKRNIENDVLRKKISMVEDELEQTKTRTQSEEMKRMRKKHDDVLTKAKELLFEKTKRISQLEQQIEAYKLQIVSLKDVVGITKDMLEIRNVEIQHLQTRFETIDLRLKAEKERQALTDKKLKVQEKLYSDLKEEYVTQSDLFKVIRNIVCIFTFSQSNNFMLFIARNFKVVMQKN